MLTRDMMTRRMAVASVDEPIARAAELMRDQDAGLIPAVGDRDTTRLRGVITDRDITVRCVAALHGAGCRVGDHMSAGGLS